MIHTFCPNCDTEITKEDYQSDCGWPRYNVFKCSYCGILYDHRKLINHYVDKTEEFRQGVLAAIENEKI